MKRGLQLAFVLGAAVLICSGVSHLAVGWLGLKVSWGGYKHYGPQAAKPFAILHCSSPGYDGIDWGRIAGSVGGGIESWATPGSSAVEWELMHDRCPHAKLTFVGVSAYDLNEYFVCDFRAEIVPLSRTIRDLQQCRAELQLCRRILRQYPLMLVRKLFPSVGRSDGVMVGIRAKLQRLAGRSLDAGEAPKFGVTAKSDIAEKLSDWSEARLQRRLLLVRAACQAKHSFNGPKKLALVRLLQRAAAEGPVVLVVVPLPPAYRQSLLPPAATRQFEEALADVQRLCPQVQMARVDQLPMLNEDCCFYDLVHLNMYGQEIATESLLGRLDELLRRQ